MGRSTSGREERVNEHREKIAFAQLVGTPQGCWKRLETSLGG